MGRVQPDHSEHDDSDCGGPAQSELPLDPGPGEPVQNVNPNGGQGRDDICPVSERANLWILQSKVFELENVESRQ